MEPSTDPLIRITVCVTRKPGLSESEFHDYWANHHGPLVRDWLIRCGIVRYVQYHTPTSQREKAQKMSEAIGRPVLSHDGMADFYVKDYSDFEAAFLDPEYEAKVKPDEERLFDIGSLQVTVGVEHVVVDDGQVVVV